LACSIRHGMVGTWIATCLIDGITTPASQRPE
jgi:hypothetical protein